MKITCDEAIEAFKKALEIDPKYAIAWNNLGNLLMNHNKDYAGAFKKALEIDAKYNLDYIFEMLCYDGGIP